MECLPQGTHRGRASAWFPWAKSNLSPEAGFQDGTANACQTPLFGYIAPATMNAAPLLNAIVAALAQANLEAVLIGNAAAAIHGAPVTTLDFDFMFRETPANLTKLKRFADTLEATLREKTS